MQPAGKFYCNQDHKVAYLATRKCASSSIAIFIAGHKTTDIAYPVWTPKNARLNFDIVTADEGSLSDYFTFTFVRNPYDRFLSFYRHWIVSPLYHERVLRHYDKFGFYQDMPFEACVGALCTITDKSLLENHTTPMHRFVYRDGALRVKFIGKLENISVDFGYVKAACALKGELPHRSESNRHLRQENPYTPELRSLIYSFYRCDFELFGYER